VHFSKFITIIVFLSMIVGQSIQVNIFGTAIGFEAVDSLSAIQKLDSLLKLNNDPDVQYKLKVINMVDTLKAVYSIIQHQIDIDSLVFSDQGDIAPEISQRLFSRILGTQPWNESNRALANIVNAYPFLNDKTRYSLGRYASNHLAAVIVLIPDFASHFSGIIGLTQDNDGWQTTGQLDLHLENAWKSAGTIDINWRRKDELSQTVGLAIEEPHPLALPVGLSAAFHQDLNQGLYVQRETRGGVLIPLAAQGRWQVGAERITVTPTDQGDSTGVVASKTRLIYMNGAGDRRDDRWLPESGMAWDIYIAFGENRAADLTDRTGRYRLQMEHYWHLFPSWLMHSGLWLQGSVSGCSKSLTEQVRFGGATILRGYREDFFSSDWVAVPQIELIYLAGNDLRLYLFTDVALQDKYDPVPIGYGIGLTQRTPGAIIKVSYGLARGDRISDGKLHFSVIGKL